MQIQPICNNINRSNFKGKFEANNDLNKLINSASDKDLMEFSLMLDVINNSKDSNYFYIKEKKPNALNPDKGFILWCQEHWDSFPKAYKCVVLEDLNNEKSIAPVLGAFTGLLKNLYRVNFDKDIKSHFQKQIVAKLTK